jgi:hypothetical protein
MVLVYGVNGRHRTQSNASAGTMISFVVSLGKVRERPFVDRLRTQIIHTLSSAQPSDCDPCATGLVVT